MIVSVLARTILKGHREVKLSPNPLIPIKAKTNPQRHKEANKINMQCGSTIVQSNEISMPPSCRLKFVVSVYSLRRYERHSQCQRGML